MYIKQFADIKTARPFDYDANDTNAVFSAAGIYDFSTEEGSNVTPEIGGLIAHNFNDKFGISLTGSYSRRNFRNESNTTESFDPNVPEFPGDDPSALTQAIASGLVPEGTDVVFTPRTFIAEISDNERTRTNFQAVGQFRPTQNLTLTADATLSRFTLNGKKLHCLTCFLRPLAIIQTLFYLRTAQLFRLIVQALLLTQLQRIMNSALKIIHSV